MLAVLLICHLGQDPYECQRMTARSVLTHETAALLPYPCLEEAQQYAAMNTVTNRLRRATRFGGYSGPHNTDRAPLPPVIEWLKISCERGSGQPTDDHI